MLHAILIRLSLSESAYTSLCQRLYKTEVCKHTTTNMMFQLWNTSTGKLVLTNNVYMQLAVRTPYSPARSLQGDIKRIFWRTLELLLKNVINIWTTSLGSPCLQWPLNLDEVAGKKLMVTSCFGRKLPVVERWKKPREFKQLKLLKQLGAHSQAIRTVHAYPSSFMSVSC